MQELTYLPISPMEPSILDQEDDFEFSFTWKEPDSSPISADEIFSDGRIKPMCPLKFPPQNCRYNIPLKTSKPKRSARLPLKKLLNQEREWKSNSSDSNSSSSDEADELEGVAPEMYCVWRPKACKEAKKAESIRKSPSMHSKYGGSNSNRWKLKDLLLTGKGQRLSNDLLRKGRSVRVASENM